MIIFEWKNFRIDLESLRKFLKNHCPNGDGIICYPENFIVVTTEGWTTEETDRVTNYYENLTEQGELEKINLPQLIYEQISSIKLNALSKRFSELTILEKKILFGLPVTEDEVLNG